MQFGFTGLMIALVIFLIWFWNSLFVIKEWERGYLEFAESQFPQVPQRIKSEKVLSKETEADLKRALENYNQSFGSRKKA
jgi:hypothetical protein